VLGKGAKAAIGLGDDYAMAGVRRFASPTGSDPVVISGETGAAGLAALLAARDHAAIRATLGLSKDSRVLLLGSEGDTDPVIYRSIVGRSAEEVLSP